MLALVTKRSLFFALAIELFAVHICFGMNASHHVPGGNAAVVRMLVAGRSDGPFTFYVITRVSSDCCESFSLKVTNENRQLHYVDNLSIERVGCLISCLISPNAWRIEPIPCNFLFWEVTVDDIAYVMNNIDSEVMKYARFIEMFRCGVDADACVLIIAQCCPELEELEFSRDMRITDAGLAAIAECFPGLRRLKVVFGQGVTPAGFMRFQQALLGCQFT